VKEKKISQSYCSEIITINLIGLHYSDLIHNFIKIYNKKIEKRVSGSLHATGTRKFKGILLKNSQILTIFNMNLAFGRT